MITEFLAVIQPNVGRRLTAAAQEMTASIMMRLLLCIEVRR